MRLADPGPAALLREHGPAVLGVLAAHARRRRHAPSCRPRLTAAGSPRNARPRGRSGAWPSPGGATSPPPSAERGLDARHADPGRAAPVRRPPDQVDRAGGLGVREAQAGRAARGTGWRRRCSAKPASTTSRARARSKAPESDGRGRRRAHRGSVSSGGRRRRDRRRQPSQGRRARRRPRPAAPPGIGQRGVHHVRHAVGPDDAGAAGRARRPPGERRSTLTAAAALRRRWSSSC